MRPAGPLAAPEEPFPRALLWVLVLVAIAAHCTGLTRGFLNYDDGEVRAEVASKSVLDLWTGPFYFAYKPVYATSLWIDSRLFDDALGWHVGNLALFAACVACAALLAHGIFRSRFVGAAVGLLLATHPVHVENVAWVAERKDVLSLLLALLAHLSFRASRARAPDRVPVLACVLLALGGLAKGTVWTYALVIAVDDVLSRAPGRVQRVVPVALVAFLGVVLDVWVGRNYGPGDVHHDATTLELAGAMAAVHARYLGSLLLPLGLSIDYGVDPRGSLADPLAIAGVLLALAAVVGLVVGLKRRRPVLAIACALWIAGLAPVNNVWPATSVLRADRYLIIPALGLYALLAVALERSKAAGIAVLCAAAVALGVGALARSAVFHDPETLWTDAVEKHPGSALAWLSRAQARQEKGMWRPVEDDAHKGTEAARALRRPELEVRGLLLSSLALLKQAKPWEALPDARAALLVAQALAGRPGVRGAESAVADAHARVGQALRALAESSDDSAERSKGFESALAAFRSAAAADPDSFEARLGLAQILSVSRNPAHLVEARTALDAAERLQPGTVEVALLRVGVLYNLREVDEARRVYAAAIARHPDSRELMLLRARVLLEGEDEPEKAAAEYERLLARDPRDAEARRRLAALRRDQGVQRLATARANRDTAGIEEAVKRFDQALAADPQDVESLLLAGDAALESGRVKDARDRYAKARAARPSAAWIRNLEARAAVFESVSLARRGLEIPAAAAAAEALSFEAPRLDLGYAALDFEQTRLRAAVPALSSTDPAEAAAAGAVLRAAAWLVAGDDVSATAEASRALAGRATRPEKGSAGEAVESSALLVRALARARGGDLAAARTDLDLAGRRDPDDPVVRHHAVRLERTEAQARLKIAQGGLDSEALEAAKARAKEADAKVLAAADASPPWPGPGLLAVEVELQAGDSLAALKRLTALADRFPDSTAVRRGTAYVYQVRVLSGGDKQQLLSEARRALVEAKGLDPRDPRTALDLSQLYRLEGNLDAAAKNALVAAAAEPIPGPAARAYAAILVELGKRALDGKEAAKALKYSVLARAADRSGAGPDLLEGDVQMATNEWEKALRSYERAREKEPGSPAVRDALVLCHRRRGEAYFLWRLQHPRPAVDKNGAAPDPQKLAEWEKLDAAARRQAIDDLEAALRLDPDGPESSDVRESLDRIRKADPEEDDRARKAAEGAFIEGEALRGGGKLADAAAKYHEAVRTWPDHLPAWMRIAEVSLELGESKRVDGLRAVERVRDLDPDARYPVVDLYAGMIWHAMWLAGTTEDAAARAKTNLERFLSRTAGLAGQDVNRARAQVLLDRLAKGR